MSTLRETRHFVSVAGRGVHYRRRGSGPAVVMLHGSPQSSRAVAPMAAALSHRFTCISLDTPGNGLSDPLPLTAPSAEDYADALAETLDALGLGRVLLYGFHTGAGTGMTFLQRHPGRCAALACDGYAVWTDAERADMLARYLPPLTPSWDGAHLTFLWARMEEQSVFFPWYAADDAHRIPIALHTPEHVHANARDVLIAGDAHRAPYAAAFRRRGEVGLDQVRDPVLIAAAQGDPLVTHMRRLPADRPEIIHVEETPGGLGGLRARFTDFLSQHADGVNAPPPPPEPVSAPVRHDYSTVADEPVRMRLRDGSGAPLLMFHDPGGSSALFAGAMATMTRPVIAVDLPGHGDSAGTCPMSVKALVDWAAGLADTLNLPPESAAAGFHLGGLIAAGLHGRGRVRAASMIGAPVFTPEERAAHLAHYAPDLSPSWEGAHFPRAWRMLRRQALFYPWYDGRAANAITGASRLALPVLQRRFVDLMKAGASYRAAYAAQHSATLADWSAVKLVTAPFDPLSQAPYIARARAGGLVADPMPLPDDPGAWGAVMEHV